MLRRYLNPVWHLWALCVVTVVFVGGSFLGHWMLHDRYACHASKLLNEVLKLYAVDRDSSGNLALMIDGAPRDNSDREGGAFGLDRSPAVRGALSEAAREADKFNHDLELTTHGILKPPSNPAGGQSYFTIDPASLGDPAGSDPLQVSLENGKRFLEREGTDPEQRVLLLLKSSSRLPSREAKSASPTVQPETTPAEKSVPNLVKAARAKAEGLVENVGAWNPVSEAEVRRWQSHVMRGALDSDEKKEFDAQNPPSVTAFHARNLTTVLRNSIKNGVNGEHDSIFWLIGFWKWFEIAIWTCFGVFAKSLYEYGTHAIGRPAKNEVFEPRESWRILARLLYAPLLALVFFWLAVGTGLVNAPTFLVNYTLASLSVAFVIGLFPNTIYRLLTNIFSQLLKGGEAPDPSSDSAGALVKVSPKRPLGSAGALPDFASLANHIADLVVAPLKPPGTQM
jgi:hypothetical protein